MPLRLCSSGLIRTSDSDAIPTSSVSELYADITKHASSLQPDQLLHCNEPVQPSRVRPERKDRAHRNRRSIRYASCTRSIERHALVQPLTASCPAEDKVACSF